MANAHTKTTTVAAMMAALAQHPLAWKPEDIAGGTSHPAYVTVLDEDGVAEVEQALESFKALGLDGDAVDKDNFPLPRLGAELDRICQDVHEGTGLRVVRGLNPAEHTAEDNLSIFLGIADYIGGVRGVQDRRGSMITHVTSARSWTVPPQLRHGIHTDQPLSWHNDVGVDILALHVRGLAAEGGNTYVASAWTICAELALARPDVLEVLQRPTWPVQVSGSPPRHILMPLLEIHQDKLFFAVDPGRLGIHPHTARNGGDSLVPELTSEQLQALEVLSGFASQYQLCLDLKPGDMVFLNNFGLLHARDAYVDSPSSQRHLVRLWLRNASLAWPLPASMKAPWEAAFGPLGDGNPVLAKGKKNYAVVPAVEYTAPKYTAGSAAFVLEDSEDVNAGAREHSL